MAAQASDGGSSGSSRRRRRSRRRGASPTSTAASPRGRRWNRACRCRAPSPSRARCSAVRCRDASARPRWAARPQLVESGAKPLRGHRPIAHPGAPAGVGRPCALRGVAVEGWPPRAAAASPPPVTLKATTCALSTRRGTPSRLRRRRRRAVGRLRRPLPGLRARGGGLAGARGRAPARLLGRAPPLHRRQRHRRLVPALGSARQLVESGA